MFFDLFWQVTSDSDEDLSQKQVIWPDTSDCDKKCFLAIFNSLQVILALHQWFGGIFDSLQMILTKYQCFGEIFDSLQVHCDGALSISTRKK